MRGELFERDRETVCAHDGGMDAAGDVAQLGRATPRSAALAWSSRAFASWSLGDQLLEPTEIE